MLLQDNKQRHNGKLKYNVDRAAYKVKTIIVASEKSTAGEDLTPKFYHRMTHWYMISNSNIMSIKQCLKLKPSVLTLKIVHLVKI